MPAKCDARICSRYSQAFWPIAPREVKFVQPEEMSNRLVGAWATAAAQRANERNERRMAVPWEGSRERERTARKLHQTDAGVPRPRGAPCAARAWGARPATGRRAEGPRAARRKRPEGWAVPPGAEAPGERGQ